MKVLLILLVLVAALLAAPVGHSAHRRVRCSHCRQRVHQHLLPIQVLRTTQGPKVVRVVK